MKAKEYKVLLRAVAEGLAYGLRRYMKHSDNSPDLNSERDRGILADELTEHVTNAICEWFDFEPSKNESNYEA